MFSIMNERTTGDHRDAGRYEIRLKGTAGFPMGDLV
jgi:hypothetical protein